MNRAARIATIETWCPRLRGTNWRITSKATKRYNCIAWAVGDTLKRWDKGKGNHWPHGVDAEYLFDCLVKAYMAVGFSKCTITEGRVYDKDYETVVLYGSDGLWDHAAKLLKNGKWSSKLGDCEDIEHPTPESVGGTDYGEPLVYMRRRRPRRQRQSSGKKRPRKPNG